MIGCVSFYQAVQVMQPLQIGGISAAVFIVDLDLIMGDTCLFCRLGGDPERSVLFLLTTIVFQSTNQYAHNLFPRPPKPRPLQDQRLVGRCSRGERTRCIVEHGT